MGDERVEGIALEPGVPCPRCGNEKFQITVSNRVEWERDVAESQREFERTGNTRGVIGAKMKCTICKLVWTGEGWKDETGEDWTMAESGT